LRSPSDRFARYYLPISKKPKIYKTFIESSFSQILINMENKETADKHPLSKRKFDCIVRFSEYQEEKREDF